MNAIRHRPHVRRGLFALVLASVSCRRRIPARAEHQAVGGAVGATPTIQPPHPRHRVVLDASGARARARRSS